MTTQAYTVVPAAQGWRLLDATGRVRVEMTYLDDLDAVIEAFSLVPILLANSARVGQVYDWQYLPRTSRRRK